MCKDIEEFCHSCATCTQYGKQAADELMLSHPTPTLPWQFVSQDIFAFGQKQYLITTNHYSDFYDLDELVDTLSTTIINLTEAHLARHGIALRCLTDNGPQFVTHEYKRFAQTFDFEHVTSLPYWSGSNGKAEDEQNEHQSRMMPTLPPKGLQTSTWHSLTSETLHCALIPFPHLSD